MEDIGLESTSPEAYLPFLRGDTLFINDRFLNRWMNSPGRRDQKLYLPERAGLKVPLKRVVVKANESLTVHVKELILHYNPVTTIQGAEKLTNLTSLNGISCELKNFPSGIEKLKSLQTLILRNNQITKIPTSIAKLNALKSLHLFNNKISTITPSITMLNMLETLSLGNNQIRKIPSFITAMQMLKTLGLSNNKIKEIPDNFFHGGMERVDLTGNKGERHRQRLKKIGLMR